MNVFLIGATGYIGGAVDEALRARGHAVTAAARSELAKMTLHARGTTFVQADAAQPQSLMAAVADAEAVVYATSVTDADSWRVDSGAVRAIVKALAGTEKTFVYTSTALVYGSTGAEAVTEDAQPVPPSIATRRVDFERYVLSAVRFGVRAFVVRPGFVYGGGGGTPTMFATSARERRAATIVGDGENRWATVGVRDLGLLYALVCERGRPGHIYNATDGSTFTMREIAEAASRGAGAGGATVSVSPQMLGPFGEALTLDQNVSSERAHRELGWLPSSTTIVDELEFGTYHRTAVAS